MKGCAPPREEAGAEDKSRKGTEEGAADTIMAGLGLAGYMLRRRRRKRKRRGKNKINETKCKREEKEQRKAGWKGETRRTRKTWENGEKKDEGTM